MIRISIGLNSLEFTIGKCGQKLFPFPLGRKKTTPHQNYLKEAIAGAAAAAEEVEGEEE